jgi:hypothetical protein
MDFSKLFKKSKIGAKIEKSLHSQKSETWEYVGT